MQMAPGTLRSWRRELAGTPLEELENRPSGHASVPIRGRPLLEVDVPTRNEVYGFLHHVTGPAIGLPAVRALFPNVPRCILEDLLRRYRYVWRRRYAQRGFELTWHYAGTVWAMDFTQPLHPIDGVFPYLLAIRDLASHCQLAWRPVRGEKAEDVLPVLAELFTEHGPPLVLKSDNGSGFIAEKLHQFLGEQRVEQLFSPVHRPQYNGALERSNGVLKTYTHHHAISAGHPFRWESEDVDHARQLANAISRPWGARGPSPEEAWQSRVPILEDQRRTFAAALDAHRQWAAREMELDLVAPLGVADRARLDRLAMSCAMQELGYLSQRRIGHAERAKRLSREKLARRVAEFRGAVPAPETPVAETPPMEVTRTDSRVTQTRVVEIASTESPLAETRSIETATTENSTPPQSPECLPLDSRDSSARLLAESVASDILLAACTEAAELQVFPQARSSAHGEQAFTSRLRRLITPLLSFFKTANNSQ